MNPGLDSLRAYPFERLAALKTGVQARADLPHIALSIGEPRHAPPPFVLEVLRDSLQELGSYPATRGLPELRGACARWLERRFALPAGGVDAERMVLPVNGTREALFALAQAVIDATPRAGKARPVVLMPNPFYQIYEGAALLAGAEPWYLNTVAENGYLPDLDAVPEEIWERCQLLYLCSPGNPAGAVMPLAQLGVVLERAQRHDFVVAADECYAELFLDESRPPPSLLQAAHARGDAAFRHCVVFHSLSKRSSVPGLRSGFVAGCPELMQRFLLYRTYHGCAMPVPTQRASAAAWADDAHAAANRAMYREKYRRVLPILAPVMPAEQPEGGFYVWADVSAWAAARGAALTADRTADEHFVRELFAQQNVTLVPGSYLAREHLGVNPGEARVRISLVAPVEECEAAARRIRAFIEQR